MFKLASLSSIFESCTRSRSVAQNGLQSDKQDLLKSVSGTEARAEAQDDMTGTDSANRGAGPSSGETSSSRITEKCIFCNVSKEKGFDIVWENDFYVVFNDYRPSATHHLLVVPKRHVENVKTLKKEDADMVKEMSDIGHRMLDDRAVPPGDASRRLGFHIPPFNSVQHLHLHVLGMPFKNPRLGNVEFWLVPGKNGRSKGFTWFAEVGHTVRILENGGRVGVFAC